MTKLEVKEFTTMGRGVITTKLIKKSCLFYIADLIELSRKDSETVDKTMLKNYVYDLGKGQSGLALGFGSLFNHSNNPNVNYFIVKENKRRVIVYQAIRNIKAGEQLFIDYGYQP